MKIILATAIALSLTLLAAPQAPQAAPEQLPACVFEDGSGGPVPCFWDASERGNGLGTDVVIVLD